MSFIVIEESSIDFSANKLSTFDGFVTAICFAVSATNFLNSSFFATKSVSALTSNTTPTFLSSVT